MLVDIAIVYKRIFMSELSVPQDVFINFEKGPL